jgi:hypothetical protein
VWSNCSRCNTGIEHIALIEHIPHSAPIECHTHGFSAVACAQDSGLKASSDYTTEKDRVISECEEQPEGFRATPDFLFDPPLVIHGKVIRWIDVKNSLCIPNVSIDSQSSIKLQAQKYVKRFGQGAIVWTKCGFTESLDKFFDMPGVINLSYKLRTGRRPAPNSI